MSVSPRGNSDNVFVHVHPGKTSQYEVRTPAAGRQGPGLYWYHPHAHGYVDDQILGGMSGALVVDGFERLYPLLKGAAKSSRSTDRSIRRSRCAQARCSSGALRISALRSFSNSASRAWRFMSSERMAIRCR